MALLQLIESSDPRHSLVLFPGSEALTSNVTDALHKLLMRGISISLAAEAAPSDPRLEPFLQAGLFTVYLPRRLPPPGPVLICDGVADQNGMQLLQALEREHDPLKPTRSRFNFQQFVIEHAPAHQDLSVMGGADSGKTRTMVQRTLFLLHTLPGLSPREIVMITFTRDAAHEMQRRLREAVAQRFRLTRSIRYRDLLEQLAQMPIQTIHAYALDLLKAIGSASGFGQNLRIRSFAVERRRILEQRINNAVLPSGRETVQDLLYLPVYKAIGTADRFWREMENKGLTPEEIRATDWGEADWPATFFNRLLQRVISEAETELTEAKRAANAVDLKDLIRHLDLLRSQGVDLVASLKHPPRLIFIDEFQDTDDTQVRLAAWFRQALRANLFVVGDIKQSIYRFRGATHIAFHSLEAALSPAKLTSYQLLRNYRTDAALLEEMDRHFTRWGSQGLLPYISATDRLEADNEGGSRLRFEGATRQTRQQVTVDLIREAMASLPPPTAEQIRRRKVPQVAVLVRTNAEVQQIRQWCRERNLYCQVETGGDFYTSPAAVDLLQLVEAALYPDDAAAVLNLYHTPYATRKVRWTALARLNGDSEGILKALKAHPPHECWPTWLAAFRTTPVLAVLAEIIEQSRPHQQLYQGVREQLLTKVGAAAAEAFAQQEANRYSRNLTKLLEVLRRQFAAASVTLSAIHAFLRLKRATDREEDQAPLSEEEEQAALICKTVHKAKGQEFHTVILPLTTHPFVQDRTQLVLHQRGGRFQAGWQVKDPATPIQNRSFRRLRVIEEREVRAEEARLLYVAMTRAQHRLWIVREPVRTDCWSALLAHDEEG